MIEPDLCSSVKLAKKRNIEVVDLSDDEEEETVRKENEKVKQELVIRLKQSYFGNFEIGSKNLEVLKDGYLIDDDTIDFVIRHHANTLLKSEQRGSVFIGTCQFSQKLMQSPDGRKMKFYEEKMKESDRKILQENCKSIQSRKRTDDILSKKLLMFPLNIEVDTVMCTMSHWILAVVFNPAGAIATSETNCDPCFVMVFNSMKPVIKNERHVKHIVDTWLESVVKKEKPEAKFSSDRVILSTPQNVPKQDNEYDSGAYVCHYAERVFKNFWHFKTRNMPIIWDKIKRTNPPSNNLREEMFKDIIENCDDPETKKVVNGYYDTFSAKNKRGNCEYQNRFLLF